MNLKWLPALLLSTQLTSADVLNPTSDYETFYQSTSRGYTEFFDEYRTVPYIGPDGQEHNPQGWVSLYGSLSGGTLFFTDTNNVSWDFTNTPYTIRWILAYSVDSETLFKIGSASLKGQATLPSSTKIVGFYGTSSISKVPESGMTLTLLVIGLIILLVFYDKKTTR